MAVALLERKVNTEVEAEQTIDYRSSYMTADERHNSQISANYARLINPENSVRDILGKEAKTETAQSDAVAEESKSVPAPVCRVVNARADAEIFRADSLVNRKAEETVAESSRTEEDEDEDLRPTLTTIQYKTAGVAKVAEEDKIETKPAVKRAGLTKKDKIILAVAFSVIVALFVLIIVNSAVISGLSSEVSVLKDSLSQAESTYAEVLAEKNAYLDSENLFQIVSDFAIKNGMVHR